MRRARGAMKLLGIFLIIGGLPGMSGSILGEASPNSRGLSFNKDKYMKALIYLICSGLLVVLYMLGFLVHLWTTWVSYKIHGIIGAVISFASPVVAEGFYFTYSVMKEHQLSPYTTTLLILVISWGVVFLTYHLNDR